MEERAPQHIQNTVIRDYCQKNKFQYLLSAAEYSIENSFVMLNHIIESKDDNGIVAYSLFQMPKSNLSREKIFYKILNKKKVIHFCVEQMKVSDSNDLNLIENIWLMKKILNLCPQKINYG